MTTTFRDPIIYPGAPIEHAVGKWVRLHDPHPCAIGGELMRSGTIARLATDTLTRGGQCVWECRMHADPFPPVGNHVQGAAA